MWINHIFLAFVGLASGLAVAGGTFALIVSLKIIPRIVGKGHLASRTGNLGNDICGFSHDKISCGTLVYCPLRVMQRYPGGLSFNGVGGNCKCIPGYLPPLRFKDRDFLGDHFFGGRKTGRFFLVFL